MPQNKQILLDNRPQGEATASNFKLVVSETPALADGQPCRTREEFGMSTKLRVTSGPEGWSVLGAGPWVTGFGNDALVHRYDDDGECEGADDRLFVDGFDGAG